MTRRDRIVELAVVGLLIGLAAPVARAEKPKQLDLANPPQGVFFDDWYAVTLDGHPCGWMHATTRREKDEVLTDSQIEFAIRRAKVEVRVSIEQRHRETVAGEPLAFEQVVKMSDQPVRQKGTVRGDRLELVTEQFGASQKAEYPFDREVRFVWGNVLEQHRHGLKPGTKFSLKTFEPTLRADKPIEVDFEVVGWESIELLDEHVKALKVRSTMKLDTPMANDVWVDARGIPLATEMALGAIRVRMVRCAKEKAQRMDKAPEMFLKTFVSVAGRVDREAAAQRFRLRMSDGSAVPALPETGMQKVERAADGSLLVSVTRINWVDLRATTVEPQKVPRRIRREFLRGSTYIDIADEKIVALAREGAGEATLPAAKADALRRFVSDYVTDKGLDVAMATASEVARRREGDCTEHGVLLCALARAAGLPARCVAGLIMVPGDKPEQARFGYHMWTQVWIDGQWVDIDAAMEQTDCDPTHVALAVMSMNEGALMEGAMSIVTLIGKLEMEAVK